MPFWRLLAGFSLRSVRHIWIRLPPLGWFRCGSGFGLAFARPRFLLFAPVSFSSCCSLRPSLFPSRCPLARSAFALRSSPLRDDLPHAAVVPPPRGFSPGYALCLRVVAPPCYPFLHVCCSPLSSGVFWRSLFGPAFTLAVPASTRFHSHSLACFICVFFPCFSVCLVPLFFRFCSYLAFIHPPAPFQCVFRQPSRSSFLPTARLSCFRLSSSGLTYGPFVFARHVDLVTAPPVSWYSHALSPQSPPRAVPFPCIAPYLPVVAPLL